MLNNNAIFMSEATDNGSIRSVRFSVENGKPTVMGFNFYPVDGFWVAEKTYENGLDKDAGNDFYRSLKKIGYRRFHPQDKKMMPVINLKYYQDTHSVCKCPRCRGEAIVYTRVENGSPVRAKPDSGICWKCLGARFIPKP